MNFIRYAVGKCFIRRFFFFFGGGGGGWGWCGVGAVIRESVDLLEYPYEYTRALCV